MNEAEAKALLEKYNRGECTAAEEALVETYYNLYEPRAEAILQEADLAESLRAIDAGLPITKPQTQRLWPRIAAALLLVLSLALYFYLSSEEPKGAITKTVPVIVPGGNKAILTLADGRKLVLTDSKNGNIAEESGISISKTADGQLIYDVKSVSALENGKVAYNTIETPVGGQYQVKLPDGTQVWLNAASSLRFPVVFAANQRNVEVRGEAYFEVAHNKKSPFRVKNARQTIEVLGTHFNVNAYSDEDLVKTTLLEGSVKVSGSGSMMLLSPGQQSQLSSTQINLVKNPDLDNVMAWKNGKFVFNDERIESIMRTLARWYNVEVQFTGKEIATGFGGSVSRSKNLTEVLRVLESTGFVHFKIEGRRVTVMP